MNRIGRYEVEGRLGAGGFATVYLVRDDVLDSKVAAKVLADNWTDSKDLRERFVREAQLLRRIDSNRVVTVHDIGELDSGQPYFVMSYAGAGTLEDRIVDGANRPSADDIVQLAGEVADCVRAVHDHNLIHRDIKPSNLLITGRDGGANDGGPLLKPSERLLLGDFGLAKDIALQAPGLTIAAGTGGYAAPEQMTPSGDPNRQTDLYAATAVMYRVITGTNPPNYDLLRETVPFPDDQWWMAAGLGQFFRKGMSFAQAGRHTSIDDWLNEFNAAYNAGQATVLPDPAATVAAIPQHLPTPSSGPSSAPVTPDSDPASVSPQLHPRSQPAVPSNLPLGGQPAAAQAPTVPQSAPGWQAGASPQGYQQPAPQTAPQHGTPQHGAPQQAVPHQYQPTPQSHQPSQPVGAVSQPAQQFAPHHYAPSPSATKAKSGRSPLSWLAALIVLVGAGAAGFFVVPPLIATPVVTGSGVNGANELEAGLLATFTADFDGADTFLWTDWNDQTTTADEFSLRGVVPGPVRFQVQAVGANGRTTGRATTHTVFITASPDAPEIVGPDRITVGDPTQYTFTAPAGATDPEWVDASGAKQGDSYTVTGTGVGSFDVSLIVTLTDGTRVGTKKTIQIVAS
ncbi:MAG: protein kinase [Actinomycetota bacterium]